MPLELFITPHGRMSVSNTLDGRLDSDDALARRLIQAFDNSTAQGLLHLATVELETRLSADFGFARDFSQRYMTDRCRLLIDQADKPEPLSPPPREELGLFRR